MLVYKFHISTTSIHTYIYSASCFYVTVTRPLPVFPIHAAEASDDPDCVIRSIPVAAYYAGDPDLLKIASECVSLMQKGDVAVASTLTYCRTLEKLILTDNATVSFEKILEGVVQELENPKRDFPHAHDSVVGAQLKEVLGMDRTMNNALTTKQIGSSCRKCAIDPHSGCMSIT